MPKYDNYTLFGIAVEDIFDRIFEIEPFPGNSVWGPNHPIWDCWVGNNLSPKKAWFDEKAFFAGLQNMAWITNKSIIQNKEPNLVNKHYKSLEKGLNEDTWADFCRLLLNRFTIAKIAPKVTALKPTVFLKLLEKAISFKPVIKDIILNEGLYCPMAGFGGIIEGCKRFYKNNNSLNNNSLDLNKIEAYDINKRFCDYYGWIQKDVTSEVVSTDKIIFVCPPFDKKNEQWDGTPEKTKIGTDTYCGFHNWVFIIKQYIKAPYYIFIGPETKNNKNPNITNGLFIKTTGVEFYPGYLMPI